MKKVLILLALTGSLLACKEGGDDDDGDTSPQDAGVDAARPADAASTADSRAPAQVKIENVGAKCNTNAECQGPGASCQKELMTGGEPYPLKDGYCTATCASSAECGADGLCAVVEITSGLAIPGAESLLAGILPSYCLDKCERGSTCRDGYQCKSIGELVPADLRNGPAGLFLRGRAFEQPYCVPPIEIMLPGGMMGTPDAGGNPPADAGITARLDGGLDAGR